MQFTHPLSFASLLSTIACLNGRSSVEIDKSGRRPVLSTFNTNKDSMSSMGMYVAEAKPGNDLSYTFLLAPMHYREVMEGITFRFANFASHFICVQIFQINF